MADLVVVVAPHPDDEIFGAGALLRWLIGHGRSIRLIPVTDGEVAWGPVPLATQRALIKRRIGERAAAVRRLDVHGVSRSSGSGSPTVGLPTAKPTWLIDWPSMEDRASSPPGATTATPTTKRRTGGGGRCRPPRGPVLRVHGVGRVPQPTVPAHRPDGPPRSHGWGHAGSQDACRTLLSQPARAESGRATRGPAAVDRTAGHRPGAVTGVKQIPISHFERRYQDDPDPWRFASSPYEQRRLDLTASCTPAGGYRRGFEPGCAGRGSPFAPLGWVGSSCQAAHSAAAPAPLRRASATSIRTCTAPTWESEPMPTAPSADGRRRTRARIRPCGRPSALPATRAVRRARCR